MEKQYRNEELVKRIKAGEDLYLELYTDNIRIIQREANYYGKESEDLVQQGFLVLLDAVEHYDPGHGIPFFAYFRKCLRNAFSRYVGNRPAAISLDTLIADDFTIADTIKSDFDLEGAAVESVYVASLSDTLSAALRQLDAEIREVVVTKYKNNLTRAQTARRLCRTVAEIQSLEAKALRRLRNNVELREFMASESYHGTGLSSFRRTWTSSTERAALKSYAYSKNRD